MKKTSLEDLKSTINSVYFGFDKSNITQETSRRVKQN